MINNAWQDFNDAEQQQGFDLIPRGTLVPVRMTLKPGGYDAPEQGWDGGYATESYETGSIYLAAEFVITAGPHTKRKLWSNIGLHSEKGPTWAQMGRSFVRAALNSARRPSRLSPEVCTASVRRSGRAIAPSTISLPATRSSRSAGTAAYSAERSPTRMLYMSSRSSNAGRSPRQSARRAAGRHATSASTTAR